MSSISIPIPLKCLLGIIISSFGSFACLSLIEIPGIFCIYIGLGFIHTYAEAIWHFIQPFVRDKKYPSDFYVILFVLLTINIVWLGVWTGPGWMVSSSRVI